MISTQRLCQWAKMTGPQWDDSAPGQRSEKESKRRPPVLITPVVFASDAEDARRSCRRRFSRARANGHAKLSDLSYCVSTEILGFSRHSKQKINEELAKNAVMQALFAACMACVMHLVVCGVGSTTQR